MSRSSAVRKRNRPLRVTAVVEHDPVFPAEWMDALRRVSPVSTAHSYLLPVWYRQGQRWVLYDALPAHLIDPTKAYGLITGVELLDQLTGMPVVWRPKWERAREVSQFQWALFQKYKAYCRPFWVLQGEHGGHQVAYTQWQQHLLSVKHLPMTPPPIGMAAWEKAHQQWALTDGDPAYEPRYLHPCPLDNRVLAHLTAQNRLFQLNGNIDALRRSGTPDERVKDFDLLQKDVRLAELAAVEQFMAPIVDMASSLHQRSDSRDHLIYLDGQAMKAKERLDYWLETGQYVLDPQAPPPR